MPSREVLNDKFGKAVDVLQVLFHLFSSGIFLPGVFLDVGADSLHQDELRLMVLEILRMDKRYVEPEASNHGVVVAPPLSQEL